MKCKNCNNRIRKKDEYCPKCGQKIIREEEIIIPKKRKQVFKILMIILLFIIAIIDIALTIVVLRLDTEQLTNSITTNKEWLIINIFTWFLPLIILLLVSEAGFYGLIIVDVIAIILTLLTMIKASKKKKKVLLFLLLVFLVLAIVSFIFGYLLK